jgi:hypothetical protein
MCCAFLPCLSAVLCLNGCGLAQICEAFGANRYPFPEEPTRQRQMNAEVTARLRELQTTIEAGAGFCMFEAPTQGRSGALAHCGAPLSTPFPGLL